MKATTFVKPLELILETDKESYKQGELIRGSLTIKNHSAQAVSPSVDVKLAYGNFKKVEKKDPKAFELVSSNEVFKDEPIAPGGLLKKVFNFKLSDTAPITDKDSSLFLQYGEAHVELVVEMSELISMFLQTFSNFFRFKIVGIKFKKGKVEVKLDPPNSKEMSTVESLVCLLAHDGKKFDIDYQFMVRTLENAQVGALMVKTKRDFAQKLTPKEYEFGPGAYNQNGLKKAIEEILPQALPKLFY